MLTFLSITQGALLLAQIPSPQSPQLPPAAAVVPVQAQPVAAAVPAGQPVMMMVMPAIAQTPAPQPIAVQVMPATYQYQYVAMPATTTVPASSPAMLAGELHEPGPIHRWLGQVGEKIARLKDPRISLRVHPQPQPAPVGPTAVQVIQVQAQPQPQPPAKNSAGLVEPAAALPSKQMPR
ncbi:MAG: hypothetical protein AB7W06_17295 [Alphaproteobacteria bacterium]